MYKADLGSVVDIWKVNTFSYDMGGNRGRQHFVLYGSASEADPGWDVADLKLFMPIVEVDTSRMQISEYTGTCIMKKTGLLGSSRWLIWAVIPVTSNAGGENTAFQEFQVNLFLKDQMVR